MLAAAMDLAEYKEQLWGYRRRVGAVLDGAREAFLGAMRGDSNVLTWHGEQFWVDRERWLVVPVAVFDRSPSGFTLVDDGEGGEVHENLEVFGGPSRWVPSHELLRVLGAILAGTTERRIWSMSGAHLLNLAVVQPLLNPAFAPLFWLSFAHDAPGPADNLYQYFGESMFDMMAYPTRVPADAELRRGQGRLLLELSSGVAGGDAEQRSADDWLRICTWQVHAQYPIMDRLFGEVWSRTTQAEIEARDAAAR
jgi:hypothetical protein